MNILNQITCNCSFLSGGGATTDDVQPSSGSVRETARILATEVCCHDVLKTSPTVRSTGPNAVHVRTMRTVVGKLLDKHRIVFDKSARTVAPEAWLSVQDVDEGLRQVVTNMFKDGQINWGRVAAVYAFARRLSQHAVEHDMTEMPERIADATARFVEDDLSGWILSQGGWVRFADINWHWLILKCSNRILY